MCKKAIFTSAAIALGLLVLSQTRVGNKVCGLAELAWGKIGSSMNKAVPIDVEISLIENEIRKLEGDVKKNFDALAQEMVAADSMKKEVETVRANLKDRLQALEIMRRDLKSNTQKIIYGEREYTRSQVENKFAADWRSFEVAEEGLKVKEKMLGQKQSHVEAFKAKIDSIQTKRDELRTRVLKLKTEVEEVRAAQAQCKFNLDDSRLGNIEESLSSVQNRLNVMKKRAELEGRFANSTVDVPVETKVESNKAQEAFDRRFSDNDKVTVEK